VAIEEGLHQIKNIIKQNPNRIIRIGTGEVGDSLQLDPLFEISREYLEALSKYPQVYFELKTKTNFIDHLLNIEKKGNGVIGFSLNPPSIISEEEGLAATLEERLDSAKKVLNQGYFLAFHFDPIFYWSNWEEEYSELIKKIGEFSDEKIVWISLGTFRYPPRLRDKIGDRPYIFNEFVPSIDGKFRYLQILRKEVYQKMIKALREVTKAPIYMCMESKVLWRSVFGNEPEKILELDPIFKPLKGVEEHKY
jgi:spore photoproduct lyase